jgi:L-malate glycosyltransferase
VTVTTVHQVLHAVAPGDAVSTHAVLLRDALRGAGFASELYAASVEDGGAAAARGLADLPAPDGSSALLYHASIGSEAAEAVRGRGPEPLVVNHHNITPVEHLVGWAPDMAHRAAWGRAQLAEMAPRAVLGIGDSPLNATELTQAGCPRSTTVPVLFDDTGLGGEHEAGRPARRRGTRWLFVGRVVPNKAAHDLVAALAWYRQRHDAEATLTLVGKRSVPAYANQVEALAAALGIAGAVRMAGSLDGDGLTAAYRGADVFVSCSDHEGFGIPLVEAMGHGLPVVAFGAAAVPSTVGDAGIVLPEKSPAVVAAAVRRVIDDDDARAALVAAGRDRLEALRPARSAERFVAELRNGLAGGAHPYHPGSR